MGLSEPATVRRGVAVCDVDTAVAANGWPRPRLIEGQTSRQAWWCATGVTVWQTSTGLHGYEMQVCPIVVACAKDGDAQSGWWWKRSRAHLEV